MIFSYLKIDSTRNKFHSVKETLVDFVDIFIAAEAKIRESFSAA